VTNFLWNLFTITKDRYSCFYLNNEGLRLYHLICPIFIEISSELLRQQQIKISEGLKVYEFEKGEKYSLFKKHSIKYFNEKPF
jgi:hypothetical protein